MLLNALKGQKKEHNSKREIKRAGHRDEEMRTGHITNLRMKALMKMEMKIRRSFGQFYALYDMGGHLFCQFCPIKTLSGE